MRTKYDPLFWYHRGFSAILLNFALHLSKLHWACSHNSLLYLYPSLNAKPQAAIYVIFILMIDCSYLRKNRRRSVFTCASSATSSSPLPLSIASQNPSNGDCNSCPIRCAIRYWAPFYRIRQNGVRHFGAQKCSLLFTLFISCIIPPLFGIPDWSAGAPED